MAAVRAVKRAYTVTAMPEVGRSREEANILGIDEELKTFSILCHKKQLTGVSVHLRLAPGIVLPVLESRRGPSAESFGIDPRTVSEVLAKPKCGP